jgi:hypothetical protein
VETTAARGLGLIHKRFNFAFRIEIRGKQREEAWFAWSKFGESDFRNL